MPVTIQYLQREEIDTKKWDECVIKNTNGLIYAHSYYLDTMADQWNAIVINDYEAILALPFRKKYGIAYHFKPAFIQQVGIIGNVSLFNRQMIEKEIFKRVKYGTILFNYSNETIGYALNASVYTNMVLSLSTSYETIRADFVPSAKSDIRSANLNSLLYTSSADFSSAIDFFRKFYEKQIDSVKQDDYYRLEKLCAILSGKEMCFVREIKNKNNEIVCSAVFLKDNKRIYNLISTTSGEGRQLKANYFLFDNLIREFSNQPLLLDFEGSDLKGVKDFFARFGSTDQPYFYLNYNKLPWPVNLLKK